MAVEPAEDLLRQIRDRLVPATLNTLGFTSIIQSHRDGVLALFIAGKAATNVNLDIGQAGCRSTVMIRRTPPRRSARMAYSSSSRPFHGRPRRTGVDTASWKADGIAKSNRQNWLRRNAVRTRAGPGRSGRRGHACRLAVLCRGSVVVTRYCWRDNRAKVHNQMLRENGR